jgi:hypothetical protein
VHLPSEQVRLKSPTAASPSHPNRSRREHYFLRVLTRHTADLQGGFLVPSHSLLGSAFLKPPVVQLRIQISGAATDGNGRSSTPCLYSAAAAGDGSTALSFSPEAASGGDDCRMYMYNSDKPYFQSYNHGHPFHRINHHKFDRSFVKINYYKDGKDYREGASSATTGTTKQRQPSFPLELPKLHQRSAAGDVL